MLCAVSPFGMSRIKRTQVRAAFCFSFFCFFRSTHVNQNTAVFFSLSVTRTVYVQSVSRSRMRNIPAHKKIILFYAILPVLSSRVPFRSVRSLGTPQRFYSHILPIFCVLYAGFQKTAAVFFHFVRKTLVRGLYFLLFQKNFDFLEFPYWKVYQFGVYLSRWGKNMRIPTDRPQNAFSVPSQKTLSERYW